MKPSRILITVEQPDFNPLNRLSAVAAVIYSFADLLQRNGYEIYLNAGRFSKLNCSPTLTQNNSNIVRFRSIYKFIPKRVREFLKDITRFQELKKLKISLESLPKPDLIIGWICYGSSISVDLSKKWDVPLVSIFDNPLNEEYKFLFGFHSFYKRRVYFHEKRMLSNSKAIIAYSQAVKDYIIGEIGKTDASFYYLAFTDFKRMTFKSYDRNFEAIKFAYIGSFFNWHSLDDLIDAFEKIYAKGLEFELYLVGSGPEYDRIKARVDELSWREKIKMTGILDGSELDQLIEHLHVGIVPNALWFQAPVKLFQYSAAQLCVVSKRTPTITSLFPAEEGYLFFESVPELIENIDYLLSNKNRVREHGEKAQQFVAQNYNQENYLNFFEKIFLDL